MLPIGILMIEHRLTERMIALLKKRSDRDFIFQALDFFDFFVDKCHHGKEEKFLFSRLKEKKLPPPFAGIMKELIFEHRRSAELVRKMQKDFSTRQKLEAKDIESFIRLYNGHIAKEDKSFFLPAMGYLNDNEKEEMIKDFGEFEKELLHEKYKLIIENLEKL